LGPNRDAAAELPETETGLQIQSFPPGGDIYRPVRHAAVMKRLGPYLFVMGVEGTDPVTGKLATGIPDLPLEIRQTLASGDIHRDNVEGAIVAQSWVMFENLRRFLEAAGTNIDNLLHTIVFLRDVRQTWVAFDRVRRLMVSNPPPSTALEMSRLGVSDDVLVTIHAIAGVEDAGHRVTTVKLPRDGELTTRRLYGAGVKKLGPLVFAMGTGGVDPKTRQIIRGISDLPEAARVELGITDDLTNQPGGRVIAQTWVGYQNVKRYLESAGSSLDRLVHENVFLRDLNQNWNAFDMVRRKLLPNPPPITLVETPRLGISDELDVEIHDIGSVSADMDVAATVTPPVAPVPGAAMRRAGPLLFLNAVAGVDMQTGAPVNDLDALPEPVRRQIISGDCYQDRLEGPMLAQAWTALNNLERQIESAGVPLDNVLDIIVFMRDVKTNWLPFDRISRWRLTDPPAITVVETPQPGILGELFTLDVIAAAPENS
jgi:enamine deaminase RidA (YjgF/YER057c/UK114 family)